MSRPAVPGVRSLFLYNYRKALAKKYLQDPFVLILLPEFDIDLPGLSRC